MAITLPTFADVSVVDPRSVGSQPSYPANDAVAEGTAALGKGVEKVGGTIADYAAEQQRNRNAVNSALATADLEGNLIRDKELLANETDPEKIDAIKGRLRGYLDRAGKTITDPEHRELWAAQHSVKVAQTEAIADVRQHKIYEDKFLAGANAQLDDLSRLAAQATDPADREEAKRRMGEVIGSLTKAGVIGEAKGGEVMRHYGEKIITGTAHWLDANDRPQEALDYLRQNQQHVDPQTLDSLTTHLKAKADKQGNKAYGDSVWGGSDKGYGGNRGGAVDTTGTGEGHVAPKADRVAFAREYAVSQGINPDAVVATMAGEGLGKYVGDNGTSFGDFQLHVGGGMGDEAVSAGINIRDPNTWKEQARFAIDQMAANRDAGPGWYAGQWHGAPGWAAQQFASGGRSDGGPQLAGAGKGIPSNIVSGGPAIEVWGDSLGVGLKGQLKAAGQVKGGATPTAIFAQIQDQPEDSWQGKTVVLPSGSNGNEMPVVEDTIKYLKDKGANVVAVGYGPKFADKNAELAKIAQRQGVQVVAAEDVAASEGVHPSPNGYKSMAGKIRGLAAQLPDAASGGSEPPAGTAAPAQSGGGLAPLPDVDEKIQRIQSDLDAGRISQDRANAAMADVTARYHHLQSSQANQRAELTKTLNNGAAMLADGREFDFNPATIQHFFPKEKAAEWLQILQDSKDAGQITAGVRTASPEDLARQRQQLTAGLEDPKATDYARRRKLVDAFDTAIERHAKELSKDPAGYLATYSPTVSAKFQAIDPAKPETFADYATAALAEQSRLGLPEESRSVLPAGVAAQQASKIASLDPAKVNPAAELDKIARGYGAGTDHDYWPQVFGDLVRAKLPAAYQVIATMDRPNQLVAAEDLTRALGVAAEKGGMSVMKKSLGDETIKHIDTEITTNLAEFRESVGPQSGGQALYGHVYDAAQALAGYYVFKGQSPSAAATAAVNGIINAKYDFGRIDGTSVRVPKGTLADTDRAAEVVRNGVAAEQFGPVPGNPLLSPERRKEVWLGAIRDGGWANNENDTGLVLMGRFLDNAYRVVKRADGSRIELKFDSVPALAKAAPPPPFPANSEDIGARPGQR